MNYNWELWDNFVAAADKLDIELVSRDGGCVYMDVPDDIREKFYVMCWTPLNKLYSVVKDYPEDSILSSWQHRLKDLRSNHTDFHLEFGAKQASHGSMFWFPNLAFGLTPSRDDIVDAVNVMLDRDNFEKHSVMALMRQSAY